MQMCRETPARLQSSIIRRCKTKLVMHFKMFIFTFIAWIKFLIIKYLVATLPGVAVSPNSLLQVEEMEGLGGALFLRANRGVQRGPSTLSNHAQSVGKSGTAHTFK